MSSRLIPLTLALALVSCGPDEEALLIDQLQTDMQSANTVIDSLNYQVDTSNLLIDELRAQVDSLDRVDDRLLANIQKLNKEVSHWKDLYTEQQRHNRDLQAEIQRMKVEKRTDTQAIARFRSESDSLNAALVEAHTSIRRQSDHIERVELNLAQAQDDLDGLREAEISVRVLVGKEQSLKENGYLKTSRRLGIFGKSYRLTRKLDTVATEVKMVRIGTSLLIQGKLKGVIDRYGKLHKNKDYELTEGDNDQMWITFVSDMLEGVDVLAVLE